MPNRAENSRLPVTVRRRIRLSRSCSTHLLFSTGLEQARAERTRQVWTPLAPVQAREGEAAVRSPRRVDIDSQGLERVASALSKMTRYGSGRYREPPHGDESIVEGHAERAGNVVVAGSRTAKRDRRIRHEPRGRLAGYHAEGLECDRHVGPIEVVIAVPALCEDRHQPLRAQPLQVDARRGRSHVRESG